MISKIRFICFGYALLFAVSAALGGSGEYQSTRDGKTTVWNGNPKPGESASWAGNRDKQGYATGTGASRGRSTCTTSSAPRSSSAPGHADLRSRRAGTGPARAAHDFRRRRGAHRRPTLVRCRRGGAQGVSFLRRARKSTRLNSSHGYISYAVFCLKKKTD